MKNLDWLVSVPIAHRGLHNSSKGIIENSPSAIKAAIDHGFSIELDLQETADQSAVVFHDFTLERLTQEKGYVRSQNLKSLQSINMQGTTDSIWSLNNLLEEVDGKVGLCIEIKSDFRSDSSRFVRNICECLSKYEGMATLKSV